jgi:hypothetical protein
VGGGPLPLRELEADVTTPRSGQNREASPNGSLFSSQPNPGVQSFATGRPQWARRLAPSPSPQACRKHAARDYRGATQDRHSERRPHVARTGAREAAMKENDLQYRNARLRRKIDGALKNRPELEAVVNNIALKEPTNPSPEQVQANLQERAWAIIDAEPELDGYFED